MPWQCYTINFRRVLFAQDFFLHKIILFGEECVIVELLVQVVSCKAKSTGVSGVAVQPVVDNFPHHQIMFFYTRSFT